MRGRSWMLLLALGLSACSDRDGGNEAMANGASEAALAGEPEPLNEAESEALASEAAADEAADMNLFGGNAAAGEQ